MGKDRPYQDGGGLCSPGRWPRQRRTGSFEKGKFILKVAKELLKESAGSEEEILGMMLKLATGKTEESPFEEAVVDGLRSWLFEHLGVPAAHRGRPEGQEMYLGTISFLLKDLGDPDWSYPLSIAEGVPLGVGRTLPRTPAVFEEKTKWALN